MWLWWTAPLLGCWKNISEWKRCQWVKKKNIFIETKIKKHWNTDYKRRQQEKILHFSTHTHTHSVVNQFISLPDTCPLSSETAGILLCSVTSQTCTPSPWKQSCHPSWVSVCLLPPKHRHTCIYSQRKNKSSTLLKLTRLNPWVTVHLVVTAWVPVGGAEWSDCRARGGRERGGGEGGGDRSRDSLSAVHHALRDR